MTHNPHNPPPRLKPSGTGLVRGKGKSASLEARETAFACYRECGGNVEAAVRLFKKKGYTLSKPSFYEWLEKYNFKERLTAADAKAQEAKDAALTTEAQLLVDLKKQKDKYEKYFETLGSAIDNQAQYAYANLIKTIIELVRKTGLKEDEQKKLTRDEGKRLAEEILESEYGITR